MNDVILMKAIKEVREYCESDKEIVDAVYLMGWSRKEIRSMIKKMKRSPFWKITKSFY